MAFSDTYNSLRTATEEYFSTVLTGDRTRKEMNDPYNPESGKTDDLNSAWGFKIGSESIDDVFAGSTVIKKGYAREFELLLSNQYVNGRGEADKRVEKENILVSDGKNLAVYLQDRFMSCPFINSISFQGDNGIEFINGDSYIAINFNLTINYQE